MSSYVIRRGAYMIVLLWLISIVSFAVIQLPPGDFVTSYAHKLQQDGDDVSLLVLNDRIGNMRGEPGWVYGLRRDRDYLNETWYIKR